VNGTGAGRTDWPSAPEDPGTRTARARYGRLVLNVVVGIVGALGGGWSLSPVIGGDAAGQDGFSAMSLVVSFGGAMILLVIVNLIRQITADNELLSSVPRPQLEILAKARSHGQFFRRSLDETPRAANSVAGRLRVNVRPLWPNSDCQC
jgi:uncharacterized membrane protein YeaQ/YmgE (transglycosylase-associated protein family)